MRRLLPFFVTRRGNATVCRPPAFPFGPPAGDFVTCRAFGSWPDWPSACPDPTAITAADGVATLHLDGAFWPRVPGHVALVADRNAFFATPWDRQGYSLAVLIDLEPSLTVATWLECAVSPFVPVALAGPWPNHLEQALRAKLIRALTRDD